MTDVSTPVIVLKIVEGRLPHGGVGVVRTLGRLGVPVFLIYERRHGPVAVSRFVRETFVWEPGGGRREGWLSYLEQVADQVGARPILLPVDDVGALFVADNRHVLVERFLFPNQPPGLVRALSSKRGLNDICERVGIPAPNVFYPASPGDVERFAATAVFPIVAKSMDPEVLAARRRGHSVYIANTPGELLEYYSRVEGDAGAPNLMLQEYIPGGPETVWMFNGYFDASSRRQVGFTGQKLRQHPPYTGMSTLAVVRDNPEVRALTERLMSAIEYRGIVDMGYRFDVRDGRYKLLDVNPRVGATFRLFVGTDGMDVVRAMYLDLTGQPVPPSVAPEGRKWILETHDPVSCLTYHRDGVLSGREWVRSLRGIREGALFALDDPRPFVVAFARLLPRAAQRSVAAARRVLPSSAAQQRTTKRRFHDRATVWRDVYERPDVVGAIYRQRIELTLRLLDRAGASREGSMLDAGCGAGPVTGALTRAGYRVHGTDAVWAMIELARAATAQDGATAPTFSVSDAEALPFADASFDAAVALGLVPWVPDAEAALRELSRVVRPGGHVVVSADNLSRLTFVLDPWKHPTLSSTKRLAKRILRRIGLWRSSEDVQPRMHRPEEFDEALAQAGFVRVRGITFGFGPFTVLGRPILPAAIGLRAAGFLERRASSPGSWLRRRGNQYVVLARTPQ
jgi:D-aspartate ligase